MYKVIFLGSRQGDIKSTKNKAISAKLYLIVKNEKLIPKI